MAIWCLQSRTYGWPWISLQYIEKDLLEVAHRMWMQAAVRVLSHPILCLVSISLITAQAALPHRNICSQDASAEMSLEGIELRLAEDSGPPLRGQGREGTPSLTLVLCCFSGIWRKNVVSDFMDCQNEARWQRIKCNTALLFLGSWLHFPWSKEPSPCFSPSHTHPPPLSALPMGSPKPCPKEGKRASFAFVGTANWKLLTSHASWLDFSPRVCLLFSPSDEIPVFCNWSDWFACLREASGWAAGLVKPGFLQICVC